MKFFALTLFLLFVSTATLSISAQDVSVSLGEGGVKRGVQSKGVVTLTIPHELHVNSNKPNSEYAIPTTVRLVAEGLKLGPVEFPLGVDRKFPFSENLLNVYEGTVAFPFNVTVPKNFKGTSITVKATVRYQACSNEVCFPPKSKTVEVTAAVN